MNGPRHRLSLIVGGMAATVLVGKLLGPVPSLTFLLGLVSGAALMLWAAWRFVVGER